MSYSSLGDPSSNDESAFASCVCAAKFCNFGLVTSRKWTSVYVTVLDSVIRVYTSKEACMENEHDDVVRIVLNSSGKYQVSEVKKKNYSTNPLKIVDFWCFYVQIDNGMFAPTKVIKIGCQIESDCRRLVRAIKLACDDDI